MYINEDTTLLFQAKSRERSVANVPLVAMMVKARGPQRHPEPGKEHWLFYRPAAIYCEGEDRVWQSGIKLTIVIRLTAIIQQF
jgi:hypothetical protein